MKSNESFTISEKIKTQVQLTLTIKWFATKSSPLRNRTYIDGLDFPLRQIWREQGLVVLLQHSDGQSTDHVARHEHL